MKAITTTDQNYYEVTLVVAVPNYGDNGSTALDYIAGMDSAVIVLEATEKRLSLHTTVAAAVVTNVVNNTTTSTNVVAPTSLGSLNTFCWQLSCRKTAEQTSRLASNYVAAKRLLQLPFGNSREVKHVSVLHIPNR